MISKNTLVSTTLIIAVALGGLTTFTMLMGNNHKTPENALPDAIMTDVTATIFDSVGKVSMRIITPKLVHFANHDTTELTTPEVSLYRKSPQPWVIHSDYAEATAGLDNVHFWQNVNIHHPASFDSPSTMIKTTTLMVHPNEQTAETNALITLYQPNITVNAIGMTANIDTGDIKLLSQARGEYAPSS